MPWGYALLFGAVWGSFAGVLISRGPAGERFGGRSRCDACRRTLGFADLIPVLSWLWGRGRCRVCGAAITWKWTAVEISTSLLFGAVWAAFGPGWRFVIVAPFLGLLLALALIDFECGRLPNSIVYPTGVFAVSLVTTASLLGSGLDPRAGLVGAIGFGGLLFVILLASRGGMGMGDVKLAGVIGFVIGAVHLASVPVAAGASIAFGGLSAMVALARGAGRRSAIPFGPMLAGGAAVAVFWGPAIADAYVSFLIS